MANAVQINFVKPGTGYNRQDGLYVDAPPIVLQPLATLGSGVTVGPVYEVGDKGSARLQLEVSAKSGTSPTCDSTVQTSPDGVNGWSTVGTFTQRTDAAAAPSSSAPAGLVMGAVSSSGTTPPTITLSGTQLQPVDLKIECTTLGARGVAVIRYSVDAGKTWVSNVTTAATISVVDPNGTDTGLVINYANAAAAVDNVWTAKTVGYERKVFAGLDRFVRVVSLIGGSSTPTMDVKISGEIL